MDIGGLGCVFHDELATPSPADPGTSLLLSPDDLHALLDEQLFPPQPGSQGFAGQGASSAAAQTDAAYSGGAFIPLWPQPGSFDQAAYGSGMPDAATCSGPSGRCSTTAPKPRLRWTQELHARFLAACNSHGGPERATPKQILVAMDVPGVTLRHVKSHLQKYRTAIKGGSTSKGGCRGLGDDGSGSRKRARSNSAGSDGGASSGEEEVEEQCKSAAAMEEEGAPATSARGQGCDEAGAATLEPGSAPSLPALQQQAQHQGAGGQEEAGSPESGAAAQGPSHSLPLEAGEQLSNTPAPQQQSAVGAAGACQQAGREHEPAKPPAETCCADPGPAGVGEAEEQQRRRRMLQALAEQQELQNQLQKALETQRQLQNKMLAHGRLIEGLLALGGGGGPLPARAEPPSEAVQRDRCPPKLNRSGSSNSRRSKAPRLVLDASGGLSQTSEGLGGMPSIQQQQQQAAAPQRAPMELKVPAAAVDPSPFCSLQALPQKQAQQALPPQQAQQAQRSLPPECLDPTVIMARLAHGLPVHQVELVALLGHTSPLTPSQKAHVAWATGLQQLEPQPAAASDDLTACLAPAALSGSLGPLLTPQQPAPCAPGQQWLDGPSDCSSQQAATTVLIGRSACNPSGECLMHNGGQRTAYAQLWPTSALPSCQGTIVPGMLGPASRGSPHPAASVLTFLQQQQQQQHVPSEPACSQQQILTEVGQASDTLLDDSNAFDDELLFDALL